MRAAPQMKFCPIISLPALFAAAQQKSVIEKPDGSRAAGAELLRCQGASCALYAVTDVDEKGAPTAGACGFVLIPQALGVANSIAIQALKGSAEGEKTNG
jgi:hypothetical protein